MDRATRDRLKKQAEDARRAKAATAPAAAPSQAAPVPAPVPQKPAGAPPSRVTCSCGHEDNNRPCGACRNAAKLAKAKTKQAKKIAVGQRPPVYGQREGQWGVSVDDES